jgi:trimethylamine:corrinoid methyltransferase-like protein
MTEKDIQKYGEIQYLKGRLDELQKAYPTVMDLGRKRKLDMRIQKYYNKLMLVDELSYHSYIVETLNRRHSKEKSKKDVKMLLEDILNTEKFTDKGLIDRINKQIDKYMD